MSGTMPRPGADGAQRLDQAVTEVRRRRSEERSLAAGRPPTMPGASRSRGARVGWGAPAAGARVRQTGQRCLSPFRAATARRSGNFTASLQEARTLALPVARRLTVHLALPPDLHLTGTKSSGVAASATSSTACQSRSNSRRDAPRSTALQRPSYKSCCTHIVRAALSGPRSPSAI